MMKPLFDPDPELVLTDYLYNLLLTEICKRLDLVDYLTCHLKMDVTEVNESRVRSHCLWCGGTDTLLISRRNGSCECGSCCEKNDLLTLLCKGYNMPLLNTVARLTGILEGKDKNSALALTAKGGAA